MAPRGRETPLIAGGALTAWGDRPGEASLTDRQACPKLAHIACRRPRGLSRRPRSDQRTARLAWVTCFLPRRFMRHTTPAFAPRARGRPHESPHRIRVRQARAKRSAHANGAGVTP